MYVSIYVPIHMYILFLPNLNWNFQLTMGNGDWKWGREMTEISFFLDLSQTHHSMLFTI